MSLYFPPDVWRRYEQAIANVLCPGTIDTDSDGALTAVRFLCSPAFDREVALCVYLTNDAVELVVRVTLQPNTTQQLPSAVLWGDAPIRRSMFLSTERVCVERDGWERWFERARERPWLFPDEQNVRDGMQVRTEWRFGDEVGTVQSNPSVGSPFATLLSLALAGARRDFAWEQSLAGIRSIARYLR